MEKKVDKNQVGHPSDTAAAHNVPDPQDAQPQAEEKTPEVRYNTTNSRNVMKRGQYQPGCWAQGGTLLGFASLAWALSDLAEMRGIDTNPITNEVEKIRAARVGKESRIWIHPADPLDTDGVKVTRTKKGQTRINLYTFLAREKLLIAVRRRERFELEIVTDSRSPVGPALLLDFSKALETQVIPPRKKKSAESKKDGKNKNKKGPEESSVRDESDDEE